MHSLRRSLALAPLAVLLVALAACGPAEEANRLELRNETTEVDRSHPGAVTPTGAVTSIGTRVGDKAPETDLPLLGRVGRMTLSEHRGKVIMLSFWASWCTPCQVETVALEEAWGRYKDKDVVFIGISVDDRPRDAEAFLQQFPVTYPMLIDAMGNKTADDWRISSLPANALIDKKGVVRERHLGYTPELLKDSLTMIDDLLRESAP